MNEDLFSLRGTDSSALRQRAEELSEPTITKVAPGLAGDRWDERTKYLATLQELATFADNNPNADLDSIVSAIRRTKDKYYPEKTSLFDKLKMAQEDKELAEYSAKQVTSKWMEDNPNATPWDAIDVYKLALGSSYSDEAKDKLNAIYGGASSPEYEVIASGSSDGAYNTAYRRPATDEESAKSIAREELRSGGLTLKDPITFLDEQGDLSILPDEVVEGIKNEVIKEKASEGTRTQDEYGIVAGLLKSLFGDAYSPMEEDAPSSSEGEEPTIHPSTDEQRKVNEYTANQELTEYIKQNPEASDEDIEKAKQSIRDTWGVDPTVDISGMRKVTSTAEDIEYTYKDGDTFGQVLLNLGLSDPSGRDLWGPGGDVEYYTNQLHDQGIWGNVPVGQTIRLKRRPGAGVPSAPNTGAI